MGEDGVSCGNCGVVNDTAAQFCQACGVLLAAYQSPTGARTDIATDQPSAAIPDTADVLPAAPVRAEPTSGEGVDEEPPTALSIDDIFGSLPDAEVLAKTAVPTPGDSDAPDLSATIQDDRSVELEPEPPDAPEEAPPSPPSSAVADAANRPDGEPAALVAVERPPSTARPAVRPTPTVPRAGWSQVERGQQFFGTAGQRASSTPPQTFIVIGAVLILASCVLGPTATAIDLPLIFAGPMWCAFPAGVIVLVIGLIQLASRRPNRF